MDNLENDLPAQIQGEPSPAQYDSLRQLVVSILVLLMVVSGTLNVFLLRQSSTSRQELEAIRPQVDAMVSQYQRSVGPAMDEFERKLVEFGRSHADFVPLLSRHLSRVPTRGSAPSSPAKVNQK
jgi:hypothetical protein